MALAMDMFLVLWLLLTLAAGVHLGHAENPSGLSYLPAAAVDLCYQQIVVVVSRQERQVVTVNLSY